MLSIRRIDSREDIRAAMQALRRRLSPEGNVVSQAGRQRTIEVFGEPLSPAEIVGRICRDVKTAGLPALLDYTARIDHAPLTAETLRVPAEELAAAHAAADAEFLAAVRSVRRRIWDFQAAILHKTFAWKCPAAACVQRYRPLDRVGLCVPGGAAAYPSTVLMTAVPAQVAGVKQLALVAPPTKFGAYNPDLLATCRELGIDEVYRMGGAQAVAALAYGVEGLPRVDKIVGPGNLFVALAKKHVYGDVDIDSIAGPSEVVVIVDRSTRAGLHRAGPDRPGRTRPGGEPADRLGRKGPGPGGRGTRSAVGAFGSRRPGPAEPGGVRGGDPRPRCRRGLHAGRRDRPGAPAHRHGERRRAGRKILHAGAIFLGNYTPVALGDYAAGPSHVLPTSGTARFASGLSTNDFLRGASLCTSPARASRHCAPDVEVLADEGRADRHTAQAWSEIAATAVTVRRVPDERQ